MPDDSVLSGQLAEEFSGRHSRVERETRLSFPSGVQRDRCYNPVIGDRLA
jgi:hypothetical protein